MRTELVEDALAMARLEDISDLVGHSSTSVTETVYRHEIRPALTKGTTAMNRILKANATKSA
jgi:integrase